MSTNARAQGLFDPNIIRGAALDALRKLDPRKLARNPVIFVTEMVSIVVTGFFIRDLVTHEVSPLFSGQIAFWLWFTVLFANFAEAVAEEVGSLTVVQHQPHWIRPTKATHGRIPDALRWVIGNVPHYQRWFRLKTYWYASDNIYPVPRIDPEWYSTHVSASPANTGSPTTRKLSRA